MAPGCWAVIPAASNTMGASAVTIGSPFMARLATAMHRRVCCLAPSGLSGLSSARAAAAAAAA
eukprot:CAMPEP_0181371920 /NCGR_PEP_ID=MMETSP1106-20121128/14404_1 /TAXON_ID=81844 /ORGANISM="Mantoniella antarctica, Strain SL-175" /LENGTH=62 /DNA_ID=CAMNT_0023489187 /DNA_START=384 /DNA_END=568 /DNA_ORIENTATION=+